MNTIIKKYPADAFYFETLFENFKSLAGDVYFHCLTILSVKISFKQKKFFFGSLSYVSRHLTHRILYVWAIQKDSQ